MRSDFFDSPQRALEGPGFETAEPGGSVDLLAYVRAVYQRKWTIMGLVLAVGMLAYLYAHSLEPVYRANATLLMDLGGNRISPVKAPQVGDSYLAYYRSLTYYETQSRLIRSQSLAEKVVEDLELWEHPRFDPNQKVRSAAKYPEIAEWRKNFSISKLMFWREVEEAETEKKEIDVKDLKRSIAKNLAGSIQAKRLDGTDIIELYYHSNDNKLAAAVVNSYAERYIEMGMENQVDQMQKAGFWLTERMADLRRTMRDSENRLQRFLEKNDFMSDKSAGQLVDEQVGKLSDMLFSEEVAYNNQREEVRELRALQGMPVEKISKSLIIMGSETVKGLRSEVAQLQGNVEELATRYGDKHPRMISARKDLEIAVENLDKAISNAIEGATKSLERKKAKIDRLKQQLEEKKQDVQSSNRTEFSLLSLKREVDVNRELYNAFLTKFKQTNASVDLTTTNAKVIDEAEVPYEAIAPNKRKIITIASIITLLLAVGLVVLLEQLDATLKSGEDVENRLGLPTLGTLNLLRKGQLNNKSPAKMILEDSKSSFAESVRSIRTGITLSSLDDPHKVMMVTSTVPGEGKTTLAINLALSFAQMETVLLIDADMRRPSVGKYFEIPKEKPGLSDFVAGHASQEEVIHKTESGLSVMSAGAIPPNPSELLSSKRFAQHIERFSERYDRIIIDSAPVQAVADPIILSRTANIVVYVAKADATPYPLVQAAIKKMRRVNATVVGVVLNQQDANKSSRYRYYGKYGIYSRYGRYYDSYYHHDYY